MTRSFHDFKIETDESGATKRIFIDGVEQRGVTACDIRLRTDEIPTITLQYVFCNIEAALTAAAVETSKTFTDGVLNNGIEYLDISLRAYNALKRGEWDTWMNADHNNTIGDVLIAYRTGHLRLYKNMGAKSYQEVIDKLKKIGLLEDDAE